MDDPSEESFASAVERLVRELAAELGPAASLRRVPVGGLGWELTPSRPSAAAVWVAVSSEDPPAAEVLVTAEVHHFELGGHRGRPSADVLRDVESVVRSVIAGRVTVTVKKLGGATRCQLTLPDGSLLATHRNWLLPVFPWTRKKTVRYEPYR